MSSQADLALRQATEADRGAVKTLVSAAILQTACKDYSAEQISAWERAAQEKLSDAPLISPQSYHIVLVDEEDTARGYATLTQNGLIDMFYLHPEITGQGLGKTMLKTLEAHAKQNDMATLFVNASETAKLFFEKQGYAVLQKNELSLAGVAIHNYSMEKHFHQSPKG